MQKINTIVPIFIVCLFLFGLGLPLHVQGQATYYPGTAQVEQLELLYNEAGRVFPVASYPISKPSLARHAEALLETAKKESLREALRDYLQLLDYRPGSMELQIANRLSLEGYVRAGKPWLNFNHEYLDREPIWQLTAAWTRDDKMGILAHGHFQREYLGYSDWNGPADLPSNPVALENRLLYKGNLWYNFDPLQVEFGRDQVHYGPLRSSLLLSSELPFIDRLRFTLPLGRLNMELMLATLENREAKTPGDVGVLVKNAEYDNYDFNDTIIWANLHRFAYDFGRVRAVISGLVVLARDNNAYVLGDFFPVFSWHSADIRPNNLSLIFDVEAVIFPGFRLMMQFGFDDISTNALGIGDTAIPTIPAVIAGFEYTRRLSFANLDLYGEAGYTHYLWGNFRDSDPLERAIYRLALDQGTQALPLTSPYGPGTVWGLVEASLAQNLGFSTSLATELVLTNPKADLITTEYKASSSVRTTQLEWTLIVGMGLRFSPWKWLELYAEPTVFVRSSRSWFETALGGIVTLDYRKRIASK